jgi:hypothetical protein
MKYYSFEKENLLRTGEEGEESSFSGHRFSTEYNRLSRLKSGPKRWPQDA